MFNIFKKKKKHLHAMNVNSNTRSNGEELELAVSRAFKEHYENLGEPVYVKRRLYLYTNDLSDIQQIDVLGICKKGIFVIECKDYLGTIELYDGKYWHKTTNVSGKPDDVDWQPVFKWFYSPIIQNEGHISLMRKIFDSDNKLNIRNMIVFGQRSTLQVAKGEESVTNKASICNFNMFPKMLDLADEVFPDTIDVEGCGKIIDEYYSNTPDYIKDIHLKRANIAANAI